LSEIQTYIDSVSKEFKNFQFPVQHVEGSEPSCTSVQSILVFNGQWIYLLIINGTTCGLRFIVPSSLYGLTSGLYPITQRISGIVIVV
jgi:hypothetical protein